MKSTDKIRFDQIDPWAHPYRLLPIRDRDGKVFRVELGDAHAIVEPGDDRLRIAYINAEGQTRMKDLLSVLTESVGCHDVRFVEPRRSNDALEAIWSGVFDAGPPLDEVLEGYDVIEEDWPDDAIEDDDVAVCFDVEWQP